MRVENLTFQTTSTSKATSSTIKPMPCNLLGQLELPTPSNKKT
jgi:hypothetical protein